ncbi:MAG: MFS transporter [Chlamydiia bacterium]|nr:MFS transporter [Chlamydiia bacterium]
MLSAMLGKIKSLLTKSIESLIVRRLSSFTYLNVTQFTGALNDNVYKFLIVYFLLDIQGMDNDYVIFSLTGAIFVLPFLLFSTSSGTLADRVSKRNIIFFTKVFELIVMISGFIAFYTHSVFGAYLTLFMMATQSAIFSPSKYGILPELVSEEKISKANGLMTSFTFVAIILGTFLASFLTDITGRLYLIGSSACILISIIGLIASCCIEYTPPSGSHTRFNLRVITQVIHNLKIASREPSLLPALLGSSFFLFLGAFFQMNMIPYAMNSLQLTDTQGGYLFILTALGIGMGALFAAKISGKTIELGIVPLAGYLVALTCFLLDHYSDTLLPVIPLVFLLGMFGGMWQIPLDSYIQVASPHQKRGQIIAAGNFTSFLGVLLASGMLYLLTEILGYDSSKCFTLIGWITTVIAFLYTFQFFDYITRFIGMILSRLHFSITFHGQECIPTTPAIYICYHQAWNETLLLMGSQRRRMRFFIEVEQDHKRWIKRLYKLLRVISLPEIEDLEHNPHTLNAIQKSLKSGISVCIFVNRPNLDEEIIKLKQSETFREIMDQKGYPIIPVHIEQGQKKPSPFFTRLLKKFRIPASISFQC